jgi:hypothetical protein
MSEADVIKSYLIGLGFEVNQTQFDKMKSVLDNLSGKVLGHTIGMASNYVKAGAAITSTLLSIAGATVAMIDKVAAADLSYQKYALHMYMGVEAAKKMKIATDAMGESLEDIAWIPELRRQYFELLSDMGKMAPGGDFKEYAERAREIQFQLITRMKVKANYFMQQIMEKLFGLFDDDTKKMKTRLEDFNDYIQAHIPEWSEKVAKFLKIVVDLGKDIWRFITDVSDSLSALWNTMSKGQKTFAAFAAMIAVVFLGGPFMRAIAVLTLATLLLNDFYGYMDGRKSSPTLAPVWQMFLDIVNSIVRAIVYCMALIDGLIEKMTFQPKKSMSGRTWYETLALMVEDPKNATKYLSEYQKNEGERVNYQKGIGADGGRSRTLGEILDYAKGAANSVKDMAPNKPEELWGTGEPKSYSDKGAWEAAQIVSKRTNIPAEVIWGQWWHETGGFKDYKTKQFNFGGMTNAGEGTGFKSFGSAEQFANYFSDYLIRHKVTDIPNADVYAARLGNMPGGQSYFGEESSANYALGIKRGMLAGVPFGIKSGLSVGGNNSTNIGSINFDIRSTDPQEAANEVERRIEQIYKDTNAKTLRLQKFVQGLSP